MKKGYQFVVRSTHPDCGNLSRPPRFDAVQGHDKSFINIRLTPSNYHRRKSSFIGKHRIDNETFTINDIKRIIKDLQRLIDMQEQEE